MDVGLVLSTVCLVVIGVMLLATLVLRMPGQGVRLRLSQAVAPLGMTVLSGRSGRHAQARGTIDGMQVEVDYVEPARGLRRDRLIEPDAVTRVEVLLPVVMPSGQRVLSKGLTQSLAVAVGGQDIPLGDDFLDSLLRIVGDEPGETRALLAAPDVSRALSPCAGNAQISLDLDGSHLLVRESATLQVIDPGHAARLALALGRALCAAAEAPWTELAKARCLRLETRADGRQRTLSGRVGPADSGSSWAWPPRTKRASRRGSRRPSNLRCPARCACGGGRGVRPMAGCQRATRFSTVSSTWPPWTSTRPEPCWRGRSSRAR